MKTNRLREALAQYAHDTWTAINASVMRRAIVRPDGLLILPAEVVRLRGLMETPYGDLIEPEQDKDRAEADKMLALLAEVAPACEHDLAEALADAEHASWSRWMTYLFSRCIPAADGGMTIPADLVARWTRQAATDYADLSETEQQSDRDEVAHILPLIRAYALRDKEHAA